MTIEIVYDELRGFEYELLSNFFKMCGFIVYEKSHNDKNIKIIPDKEMNYDFVIYVGNKDGVDGVAWDYTKRGNPNSVFAGIIEDDYSKEKRLEYMKNVINQMKHVLNDNSNSNDKEPNKTKNKFSDIDWNFFIDALNIYINFDLLKDICLIDDIYYDSNGRYTLTWLQRQHKKELAFKSALEALNNNVDSDIKKSKFFNFYNLYLKFYLYKYAALTNDINNNELSRDFNNLYDNYISKDNYLKNSGFLLQTSYLASFASSNEFYNYLNNNYALIEKLVQDDSQLSSYIANCFLMVYERKIAESLSNHDDYSWDKNNIKEIFERIKLLYEKKDYITCFGLCSSGINLYNNRLKNNCLTHRDYKSLLLLHEIAEECSKHIISKNRSEHKTNKTRKDILLYLLNSFDKKLDKTIFNIFSEQTAYNDVLNSLFSTHAFSNGDGYKKYIRIP